MIDILLKYTLWHESLNDLDAQSDFDKNFVTKKLVKLDHSYLKYALAYHFLCRLNGKYDKLLSKPKHYWLQKILMGFVCWFSTD